MNLFHHHVSFKKADPLGDGLGEEIEAEQLEPEAIKLEDDYSELVERWQQIEKDIQKDPEWYTFSNEE